MRTEVSEAAGIVSRAADLLLLTSVDKRGREGSDLRRACGDLKAHAETYIYDNTIAAPLHDTFAQARLAGATLQEFEQVRVAILTEAPASLIATLMKQSCVLFCLQQQATVIAATEFDSRSDVEETQALMNAAFDPAEEIVADEMASMTYLALTSLHAAVIFYLYETARPLPRMLKFEFAASRPTLVFAYRLYDDASRADQLRDENKVVHPAFMRRSGRALSA